MVFVARAEHEAGGVTKLHLTLVEPVAPYRFDGRDCELVHDDLTDPYLSTKNITTALDLLGFERIGHNGVDASYWAKRGEE